MSLLDRPKKKQQRPDQRQEKRLAKEFGGRTTPASGALAIKGDVQTRGELIEAKTTAKTQYTLKLKDLRKLEEQARGAGKLPVFVIEISNESELPIVNREWVLLPRNDYQEMKEKAHDQD